MKTLAVATIFLLGTSAFASEFENSISMEGANSISAPIPTPSQLPYSGNSAKGLRVSFVKSFLAVKAQDQLTGATDSTKEGNSQINGLAIGYAHLPINNLGFTSNLAAIGVSTPNRSFTLYRLDGNLAYALTPTLNFKGGANISVSGGEQIADYNSSVGLQASVGLQFTKNLGLDAGAVLMKQTMNDNVKVSEAGPEVSLSGTF